MRPLDLVPIVTAAVFGAITGLLLGGVAATIAIAAVSGTAALLAARARVRSGIILTVLIGAMSGALIGYSVVEAICLPEACVPLASGGAAVAAVVSFVGVGLLAALVTRSFDEYYEREAAGLPATIVGCEVPEDDESGASC